MNLSIPSELQQLYSVRNAAVAQTITDPSASTASSGEMRRLRYDIRQDDSQTVSLVETAGPATRLIRTVRGSESGTLRFRPAPATAFGRRTISAFLQTRGTPAGRRTLAHYVFTEPRVRAPRLTVRPRRGRVRLSWNRVPHAIGYVVDVRLSDGQRLCLPTPARQRALKLSTVASRQNGLVTIRAIDRLRRQGPVARARFRAIRSG